MDSVIKALSARRTLSRSATVGAILIAAFVGMALYGALLVDRPVAWRAVALKREWRHRGLHLAIKDGVELYLWGPDEPGFEVVAAMDLPDRPDSLTKVARAARWHRCPRVVLLPGQGSGGGWRAYALRAAAYADPWDRSEP
jgi:hypothetical protein